MMPGITPALSLIDDRVAKFRPPLESGVCMSMKSPFGVRLWVLVSALCLVAGVTIYGLLFAWQHIQQVKAKLDSSQIERFQLASEIRRGLLSLNESMLKYTLARDPDRWAQFEQASKDLDHWIDARDASLTPNSPLTTEAERQVFKELNVAYDDYVHSAWAVHSNAQPAMVSAEQLVQLDPFNEQAQRMRELVRRLAEAHRTAEVGFFASSNAALVKVQLVLITSVAMLLTLVAAIGWVIFRDTIAPLRTKLVRSQTLLEKQERLATLGTLAAGIAHEIRNPLTSLKARLYTLEKRLQNLPSAKRDTDIISAEISRLEHIVQEVLKFARPSDPKLESIPADSVIRDVQRLMAPGLESRGLLLVVESNPGLLVRADNSHLKQVLINLVRNAAEAIQGAGTVTLRSRAARAQLGGCESDAIILEVSDDGSGIPPEVEKRLFDPFFSTKETCTGLGLPIAARMVEKLGGMLQYQTRPGHGTTFGVTLPRAEPAIASTS